eukprot:superscaffoldBa00005041_g19824
MAPWGNAKLFFCILLVTCYCAGEFSQASFQVKGATEGRRSEIAEDLRQVQPGDYVYIRVFKRKHWDQPGNEVPFKVILATPNAVKIEDGVDDDD